MYVHYSYSEKRCKLAVEYDPVQNVVTVKGGRHGYACLAETLSLFAEHEEANHTHWNILADENQDFEIAFVPALKDDVLEKTDGR